MKRNKFTKNYYKIKDGVAYVNLYNRKGIINGVAKVNAEDWEYFKDYKWCSSGRGYVVHNEFGKIIPMHRLIIKSNCVDHINGNGLDNRRCNLRIATQHQNSMNVAPRKNVTSKYRGVSFDKITGRWRAIINLDGKTFRLGRYNSEEDAAYIYDQFAIELFGEFARPNLI